MTQASSEQIGIEPVLPDAKLNLVRPTHPVTGRVVSTKLCMKGKSASFVRHVAIDVSGTELEGNFLVGQSFGVIPPGLDENARPHKVRLYSIASPSYGEDGEGCVLSTTPKRLIDESRPQREDDDQHNHRLFLGVCSNYLCNLRVGDKVQVSGPAGKRFLLPADVNAHNYIFLATGTGIAPFRGMAMELLEGPDGPCSSEIHLIMGTPYTTDLLYDDLFRRCDEEHENFHYHTAISRERQADGSKGLYVDGYLEENLDRFRDLLNDQRTLIYICGLAGMQVGVFEVLANSGLSAGYLNIHEQLQDTDPSDWEPAQVKRYVRPSKRCMLEVY